MNKKKKTFAQIKKIVEEQVKIAMGKEAEELKITFAKQDKDPQSRRLIWKVNVEYREKDLFMVRSALFSIDAISGEIIQFKKDYLWRF